MCRHLRGLIASICWVALCCLPGTTLAQSASATGEHIRVSLISENAALSPGRDNWVGVWMEPDPHWHTYWLNPGDSGEPPTLTWTLPDGLEAGRIQWPIPEPIPVAHLTNYGYPEAHLLMVPIRWNRIPDAERVTIQVDVSWLVCKEDCIPGWATLSLDLPVSGSPRAGPMAARFSKSRQHLPASESLSGRHEFTDSHVVLSFSPPSGGEWQALPLRGDVAAHGSLQQLVLQQGTAHREGAAGQESTASLLIPRSHYLTPDDRPLRFLLTNGRQGYYLTSEANPSGPAGTGHPLWLLAIMAFAGGLILNLMPCVLPVLSIKALGLQQGQHSLPHKLAYGIGVWLSFLAFAGVILGFKAAGTGVGWGFHMQNPVVIVLLSFLFLYIALNLLDLVPSGGRLAGIGQGLTQGDSTGNQFFTGVLAVLVASPCTAPFMAAALGVAVVSDRLTTLAIFTALAWGFALPLSLIYLVPALHTRLPRPGPWTSRFRQFLAFPMLATVLWLVWIHLHQAGPQAQLWLLISLLCLGFLGWCWKNLPKTPALLVGLATLAVMYQPLRLADTAHIGSAASDSTGFSEDRLASLRARNQVVVVNMTADWCITCKVNEQVAFSSAKVQQLLSQEDVHYLVGDWTNKNDEIFGYLKRYGRVGVPLYVVYAGEKSGTVLPQILTPQLLVQGIQRAKEEIRYES